MNFLSILPLQFSGIRACIYVSTYSRKKPLYPCVQPSKPLRCETITMINTHFSPYEAYKEEHEMYPDATTYSHLLSIEIPATDIQHGTATATNVPHSLSLAFTKLLSADINTTIETCTKQTIGSTDDILTNKAQFDKQFMCKVRTVGNKNYVKAYFVVKTERTFREIKDDCWEFLLKKIMASPRTRTSRHNEPTSTWNAIKCTYICQPSKRETQYF